MSLLDDYLPAHDFSERHSRKVGAGPDEIMAAVLAYRLESDPFVRVMIGLRELPMRLFGLVSGRRAELPPTFGLHNFTRLDQLDGRELVYGLIGQFWKSDFGLVPVPDGAAFRAFDRPGYAKLVLGFSATPEPGGSTTLATETRVFCPRPCLSPEVRTLLVSYPPGQRIDPRSCPGLYPEGKRAARPVDVLFWIVNHNPPLRRRMQIGAATRPFH